MSNDIPRKNSTRFKVTMSLLAAVGIGTAISFAYQAKPELFTKPTVAASVPNTQGFSTKQEQQPAPVSVSAATVAEVVNGGSTQLFGKGCQVEVSTIPWQATIGLHLANGGPETTVGSLMAKYGANVKIVRMPDDSYDKAQAGHLMFAEGYKKGEACPKGTAFSIIMGDAGSAYMAGLNEQLAKLGQGAEIIGAFGFSNGEDKFMLPIEVAKNPQLARGMVIALVARDGDYNVGLPWLKLNNIPINPDDKTYDPDAMNFVFTDSFAIADGYYINGHCEDRRVVKNGKPTGEKKNVCVQGTATWTPGDVNVAMNKGGLAAVSSTKDFNQQMASVLIGNRDWMKAHPEVPKAILRAALEGSEVIISGGKEAVLRAARVEAKVFGEQTPEWWAKYYYGVTENDKTGHPISLGGSRAMGFAEAASYFGLYGKDNTYCLVYKEFGDHYVQYYKSLIPSFPKCESVVNTSYLQAVVDEVPGAKAAVAKEKLVFSDKPIETVVADGNWNIEFDSGKATIRPESERQLRQILRNLALSKTLKVEIHGHTDDVGGDATNYPLSKKRADAVKLYLMTNAPSNFPDNRVETFGHGSSQPVAQGTSADARQKNRRVQIVVGNASN